MLSFLKKRASPLRLRPDANLRLWRLVEKTNPDVTRQAEKYDRKFTTICAQSQRQRATEIFGPYGKSWGLKPGDSKFTLLTKDLILFQGVFFYTWEGREYAFPVESCIAHTLKTKYGPVIDDECIKKVVTDAETKALSKLGFNADVFLGLFDDNRYVAELRKEFGSNGSRNSLNDAKSAYKAKLIAVKSKNQISDAQFDQFLDRISQAASQAELLRLRNDVNAAILANAGTSGEGQPAFVPEEQS